MPPATDRSPDSPDASSSPPFTPPNQDYRPALTDLGTAGYVPGSSERFAGQLLQMFKVPVGLLTLGVGVVLWCSLWAMRDLTGGPRAAVFLLVFAPAFWTVFFLILRGAARASDLLSARETTELLEHGVRPAAWATALTALAAGLYTLFGPTAGERLLCGLPGIWLCLLLLCVALPAVGIALASGHTAFRACSPRGGLRTARALGRDYLIAVAVCGAVEGLSLLWMGSAAYVERDGFQFLPAALNAFVLYAQLMVARTLGLLLSVRGDAVGYGLRPDLTVSVMPGANPLGERRAKPAAPAKSRPAFIDLEDEQH